MLSLPQHEPAKSHYEALGLSEDASQEAIKNAWRRIAARLHPDKNGGIASASFQQAKAAYDVLSNPKLRAEYDEFGAVLSNAAIEHEALGVISQLLVQVLSQLDPEAKFLAQMRSAVVQAYNAIPQELMQLQAEDIKLRKMQSNLTQYWKGTPGIKQQALSMLAGKLEINLKQREATTNKRKILTRVQQILEDARYNLPEPEPQVIAWAYYSTGTRVSNSY